MGVGGGCAEATEKDKLHHQAWPHQDPQLCSNTFTGCYQILSKKSNFACAMRHQELVHFTASVCAYLCGPGSSPWRSGRRWCPAWFSAMWWCKGGMMRETGTPFFCTNWSSTGYIQNVQYNNALYINTISNLLYILYYIYRCEIVKAQIQSDLFQRFKYAFCFPPQSPGASSSNGRSACSLTTESDLCAEKYRKMM